MYAEDFNHRSEETKRNSWEATASEFSSELSTQVSETRPLFQLYLISKKAPKSKRPLIKSTKFERLSFYNTYTIPAWKSEPICKEIVHHNSLIWLHVGNFMFKSLSHTFVHIFYASYSPEEHIFSTKMVPFCVGHKFLVLVASLSALMVSMNSLYLTFYYFINGFLYKNPWNRYNFEQNYNSGNIALLYYALLWGVTAILTFYVSKKFFWKVLHYAHWSIILTNILTVLYILIELSGLRRKREYVASTSDIITYKYWVLGLLCLYAIGIATLSEIIILYIFYPLGRLIDDYTFHYGEPPTRLRKISLQVVPFYYMIKFFALLYSLYGMRNSTKFIASQYLWCWYLMLVPLILGMIYNIYKQHVIRKASISQLFRPDPKWGPKDFSVRQLRKQYDSRVYVKSDVPRSLSRHLLSQAEPKVYKLDVRYDLYKKHHVEPLEVRFRVERENKEK
ncbi:unnamed protein product [Arctia plantaginis]|uniref:Uncharacterized protein n=1 Tax=Arctia plantaginis TaxID=874455 RepID=A0A8S0YPL4_ARCPL|nr:unnamed protein product [Arctia plantaginis]